MAASRRRSVGTGSSPPAARNSKDPAGPVLVIAPAAWRAVVAFARAGWSTTSGRTTLPRARLGRKLIEGDPGGPGRTDDGRA
ncbi:hypothetical protein C1I99_16640 [Micromonospora deserti]|uniref:DUF397 domain-containing protein n=1 Tax=Micromonospora deserti TaxID=2070366 RepID=A0A2W2CBW6_9ACTN|nr:hypothetical protein C1I99_16640 [Micromonospora deserti]